MATNNQIITEFGEIPVNEVSTEMLAEYQEAKNASDADFVNI